MWGVLIDTILDHYTFIKECCVEDTPDAHTVWLKVGVLKFCVTPFACDTAADAEAFRKRLAAALADLVAETRDFPK